MSSEAERYAKAKNEAIVDAITSLADLARELALTICRAGLHDDERDAKLVQARQMHAELGEQLDDVARLVDASGTRRPD